MQMDSKLTLALMLSMCALMTVGNGHCHHRDLTRRRCNHLATRFNCYSPSNIKCLRTVDTIQSTHVLSGMNNNLTFFNHRVEINFDSKKTGSKRSYYQFLEDGPEGNVKFIFDINKNGVATQLFQGSASWTPFAYAYINRVHLFMQCYGDQLQYTDILIGVERFGRPRRSDYRRAEELLTCLGMPQEVQASIIVPGLTTFAATTAAPSQSDATTAEIEIAGTTAEIEVTIDEDEVITDEADTISPPKIETPTTPSEAETTTAAANETEVTTAAIPENQTDVTTRPTDAPANQTDVITTAATANQTDLTTAAIETEVTTAPNEVKLSTVTNESDVTRPANGSNFPNWIP